LHYTASGIITPIGGRTATYRCDDTNDDVLEFVNLLTPELFFLILAHPVYKM